MSLYRSIEQSFFFTLTRKIVGNVLFMALPSVLLILLSWSTLSTLGDIAKSNPQLAQQANTDWLYTLLILCVVLTISATIFTIGYMRHLVVVPVRSMIDVLNAIRDKDGDISARLPAETFDEFSELAEAYNAFSGSLKRMIAEARKRTVKLALSATKVKKVIIDTEKVTSEQQESAQQVFQSSSEATQAIDGIAQTTVDINQKNITNIENVRASSDELHKVSEQVASMRDQVAAFQAIVEQLSQNSANVTKVLGMVQDFSDQTNLLALNASIEAARAGDAGRGFAVVADEVRTLAQKVSSATTEIDGNINQMNGLVAQTRRSADEILVYVENTGNVIDATSLQFGDLVLQFDEVNHQLTGISAALDELVYTNKESHNHVTRIRELSDGLKDEMDASQEECNELEQSTEQTQELLSRFIIGFGGFEDIIQTGRGWAKRTSDHLSQLQSRGANVFDVSYQRSNPGQLPEKYNVSYVDEYESLLQPIFDSFLQERPDLIYAIGVDVNGYAPAHHRRVSAPLTGDFSIDNVKSRHRRIFAGNRAEQRRASHTEPFLLQTFIRDTGEILNDLSIPIHVNGKRWGSLIMGFTPDVLMDGQ